MDMKEKKAFIKKHFPPEISRHPGDVPQRFLAKDFADFIRSVGEEDGLYVDIVEDYAVLHIGGVDYDQFTRKTFDSLFCVLLNKGEIE